jgi:putative endonuclease
MGSSVESRRRALGRYGEDVACRYLRAHGMQVVVRNWRCARGEIDIIARDGDQLVICEVKTRTTTSFGPPEESVTEVKLRRLHRLAAAWLHERDDASLWRPAAVRIDVVAVTRPLRGPALIDHLVGVG